MKEHSIPPELVINMDETGLPIVLVSDWSLDEKGTKQVPLTGLDDKRQITAVLACTATGRLLSPQLLYQGTTTRCHPKATFPETWDVWHSESHRSTHATVKRMVGTILLPYVEATKEERGLLYSQNALLIIDVFKAHRKPDVLEELTSSGFVLEFVPANCTGELQPLDISVNQAYKSNLRNAFTDWYAGKVAEAIKKHDNDITPAVADVQPDLRMSVVKPLHAGWVMDAHFAVARQDKLITAGWAKAGLLEALSDAEAPPPSSHGSAAPTPVENIQPKTSPTIALLKRSWRNDLVCEFYLPHRYSQSRLDGRSGSSACMVIASRVAKRALEGSLSLPAPGEVPDSASVSSFIDAIREGNTLYDNEPTCHGYLSTYSVIWLWDDLTIAREHCFTSKAMEQNWCGLRNGKTYFAP